MLVDYHGDCMTPRGYHLRAVISGNAVRTTSIFTTEWKKSFNK